MEELLSASKHNDRVGVDILLELGLKELLKSVFVHLVRDRHFLPCGLVNGELRLGALVHNEEDADGVLVAPGESIEHVATILAIVLVKAPPHGLIKHLFRDASILVLLPIFYQALLNIDVKVLIIRVGLFRLYLRVLLSSLRFLRAT